jgi:Rieske Fe-S protein
MPTGKNLSKRKFLTIFYKSLPVIWGGVIIWAVKNYFTFRPKRSEMTIGRYADLTEGRIAHLKKERIFIIRDSQGLYAMSDICTHLGCRVQNMENNLKCPCHKSIFDINGKPVEGPAKKVLDHFYISKNRDGELVVNTTQIVSNSFRYSE